MRDVNTQITVIYLFDFALSSIHAAWGLLPVLKLFAFSSVKIPIIALNAATAGSCGSSVARYYLNRKKWCWNQKKKKNCRNDKDFDATCFGMFSLFKNKNKNKASYLYIHLSHERCRKRGNRWQPDRWRRDAVELLELSRIVCRCVWRRGVKKQTKTTESAP